MRPTASELLKVNYNQFKFCTIEIVFFIGNVFLILFCLQHPFVTGKHKESASTDLVSVMVGACRPSYEYHYTLFLKPS